MSILTNYFMDATFWVGVASIIFFLSVYFLIKKAISTFLSDKINSIKQKWQLQY